LEAALEAVANIDPIWELLAHIKLLLLLLCWEVLAGIDWSINLGFKHLSRRADDLEKLHNSNVSRLEKHDSEKEVLN
jgi:hypothetical protein